MLQKARENVSSAMLLVLEDLSQYGISHQGKAGSGLHTKRFVLEQ